MTPLSALSQFIHQYDDILVVINISANLIDENDFEICKCSTSFFVKEAVKFLNTTKLFKGVEVLNNKEKLQKFSPKLFYL